ncbi:PAS domain S-box protein [Oleiharenicola sp. Vm1]|uniref:PAS domain S-box protein n=1 Tax=Oleiharenicola sp. Vm1 TaxID=3398393 RepID=UPI0039F58AC2
MQQSHSAVIITDPQRVIEYVNDGCAAITGYARDELVGQPSRLLLPDDVDETQRAELHRRLLSGERWVGSGGCAAGTARSSSPAPPSRPCAGPTGASATSWR